jgi:AcrR family transcriptional regulator
MAQRKRKEGPSSKPVRSDGILSSAASLFAEKGYAATTTREIAERCGLERASLYYHIDSKEDLLYRICKATLEDGWGVIERVEDVADPVERVRRLIIEHMTTILRNRDYNLTMLQEIRGLTGPRRTEIVGLRDAYEQRVRDFLADAQAAKSVRIDQSPKVLAIGLLNLLNWTLTWYSAENELSPEKLGESFADLYLEGALIRRAGGRGGSRATARP